MEGWALLIAGLGIGSLLTTVLTHILNSSSKKKDLLYLELYLEKRESFLGLMDALYEVALDPSDKNKKSFANWHNRCRLFANNAVLNMIQALIDSSEDVNGKLRQDAYEKLFIEIRKDLTP